MFLDLFLPNSPKDSVPPITFGYETSSEKSSNHQIVVFYIFPLSLGLPFYFKIFVEKKKKTEQILKRTYQSSKLQPRSSYHARKRTRLSTPWMAMFKSKPLWALILAEMGHDYGLYTMVADLPQYYYDILGIPFVVTGDLGSLPYLIMWLVSVLLGYTCDKLIALKWTTTTQLRRILATIGAVVPSVGLVWSSFINDRGTYTGVLIVSLALMGCCYCSVRVNPLDLSPNHAATVMAIINGAGAICGAISPVMVGTFMTNETPCTDILQYQAERRKDWQNVFWILFAVVVVSNFPFVIFGSGDVQPWDKPENVLSHSDLRRRSTISGGEPIREKYRHYYPQQAVIKE